MQCSYHPILADQNLDNMVSIHEFCLSCSAPDDYTALTTVVTFTDTVTTQSLSINIVDDLVFEPTEHFNISLSTSSDGCVISPGNAIVPVYVMDDGEMLHNSHCKHEYKKLHYTFDSHRARSKKIMEFKYSS